VLKFGVVSLVITSMVTEAVVISDAQDRDAVAVSPDAINRFSDPALDALHARRVALVTRAVSPSSGLLLLQSQNRISANKLNWLLAVVKSCETLDMVKIKLAASGASTGADSCARAIIASSASADRAREAERARWASDVVGRFRSVSDIRAEAVAELARLERFEAAEMVSPSADSRVRHIGLSRSSSQLALNPHSHAGFRHRAAMVDWEEDVAPRAPGVLVAGMIVNLVIRTSRASSRAMRPSRLSPLGALGAGAGVAYGSPSVSPGPQASPSQQLPTSPVFRIGQMSPVAPD
jgi:hypothetical protein